MRLFICIQPSRECLEQWETYRSSAPNWPIRWIPSELLHITLKFLGETTADRKGQIASCLQAQVHEGSFSLQLLSGGVFPLKGAPSIFWAGVDGDVPRLARLAQIVDQICAENGFTAETRPFLPHLTIGRLDSAKTKGNLRWLRQAYGDWIDQFGSKPFAVGSVVLMQSKLSACGPTYETRATFNL